MTLYTVDIHLFNTQTTGNTKLNGKQDRFDLKWHVYVLQISPGQVVLNAIQWWSLVYMKLKENVLVVLLELYIGTWINIKKGALRNQHYHQFTL